MINIKIVPEYDLEKHYKHRLLQYKINNTILIQLRISRIRTDTSNNHKLWFVSCWCWLCRLCLGRQLCRWIDAGRKAEAALSELTGWSNIWQMLVTQHYTRVFLRNENKDKSNQIPQASWPSFTGIFTQHLFAPVNSARNTLVSQGPQLLRRASCPQPHKQ